MTDNSKISSNQFLFSVACYFQSTTLLTAFLFKVSIQNSWLVVLSGSILVLPLFFMIMFMVKSFPGKNLVEINQIVFGKVLGKIISCLYLFFFLSLTALNFKDMGDFIHLTIMFKTPLIVIILSLATVVLWAVKSGLNVGVKFNMLFSIMISTFIVLDTVLVYKFIDFKNLLPIFDIPVGKFVQGVHIIMTIPLAEIIIIMMIIPSVNAPYKIIKRNFFIGYAIGVISLLIVIFRGIFVLGDTLDLFAMPSYQTLKLINLGQAISRVEILLVLVLIILGFSKCVLLLYASVKAIAQIFEIKSHRALVLSVGLIVIIYGVNVFENIILHSQIGSDTSPFLWTLFEYLLPLITFTTILLRKLHLKKQP